ncbi:deoxyguanosinetriphosphate triphosphohydrolase [Amycolatopsis sp. CA-230715]|uniref:deoxyguanosinetriphosphate triphosphohydrolase n=1 Tax=Amycolatopsis sp. CA-230715 TaxID=2745196 RepID=UPI001C02173B|nr:deoxyguanosinetriphosphate triphosphohydrolase [Amycolatopsis sp. CA-230715]QWF77292.1 Deoxyguanosinetriphosphate triphosphohydrolase-like protein [Amycolatopsis sp. CA-230715]
MTYTEHDLRRRLAEAAKGAALPGTRADGRSAFARDRARVLHSAALRRLAGKTQVVGPGEGTEISGAPRTRLTHSLEVAQIGRGIAEELGADPDLVDTAGLAHDIGHPPFGHNGENALDAVAERCGGFEGNAQTLRILTRLEPKALTVDGMAVGLNLTRACLDATTKYPWRRGERPGRKFGAYADDSGAFEWLREGAPAGLTCLEAQIMDWADDVAYSVHDVEDGVLAGRISLHVLTDAEERAAVAELATKHFSAQSVSTVEDAARELAALPVVAELAKTGYDASLGAQVALKQLTSELVGRFASAVVTATRDEWGEGPLTRYAARLAVPEQVAAEVALLKALAVRYVMSDPRRLAMQEGQRQVLAELVRVLAARAPESLDVAYRTAWEAAGGDDAKLRVVVDQVASLTDAQAHAWHSWHLGRHG